MSSGEPLASPSGGPNEGDVPKAWASGRTLSEAQRERKRQKDRASKSKRRKEDQRLVDNLKAKVQELTAKVVALEQQQQTDQATSTAPAPAPDLATTADVFPAIAVATAQPTDNLQHTTHPATTGFLGELPDYVVPTGPPDHAACTPVLPLPHETAVATQAHAGILRPEEPALVQDLFNHLMGMALVADRSAICVDEALSQDAMIRGILHGWDTVLAAPYVCPLWDILSRFDMLIFAFTSVLTRFTTLKTIRHFLLYLSGMIDQKQLPGWHRPRPTQARFPHDLAVDVLPWPLLRERAVLDPAVTKSNKFWREVIGLFELHWPYRAEEAFQLDPMTHLFTFSGLYEKHSREIRMWRMKTDFFKSFPEVFDDIQLTTEIYMQPSTPAMRMIEAAPVPTDPADEDEHEARSRRGQATHQPAWPMASGYTLPFHGTG